MYIYGLDSESYADAALRRTYNLNNSRELNVQLCIRI